MTENEQNVSEETQEPKEKGKKGIGRFVVIIIVIAVVLGMKFYNKSQSENNIKNDSREILQSIPGYENDKEYIDSIFEKAFADAFSNSYEMGGRRTSSSFDDSKYLTELFTQMETMSKKDGKTDLAARLMVMKMLINASSEESEK